jgi:hypothetical protein
MGVKKSQLRRGVKVNSGMELPMLHKMCIQTQMVSSHLFSVISLFLLAVLEISIQTRLLKEETKELDDFEYEF